MTSRMPFRLSDATVRESGERFAAESFMPFLDRSFTGLSSSPS